MADSYYKLPDNPEYRTEIRELQDTDPVRAETIVNPLIENILENVHAVKKEGDRHKASTDHDVRYYTQDEVDNKFSTLETNIDWKESVDTYADIAKTYPVPEDGWTVNVKDTDYTYRWTGNEWVAISANAIPLATKDVDGKMSKEYAAKLDGVADNANNYTHPDSGVTAGTYRSVTVNQTGHVTTGSNPTVTVAQGGTGATTAAEARTNLGVPPTSHASTATTYGVGTAGNYGHVMASSATPLVAGTANVGTDNGKYAREGHVHPVQTSVTGNAGTATKLATARTIGISGGATGTATSFDGSANITIPVTGLNMGNATAGTLAVARGGTGANTAANARTSLGVPPTSHASTATTYGVGTASNYGHAMASSATPVVAGTASAGTDNGKYAREGHVHPAQTSVTGNAGTATRLATARTIGISGGATGTATSFDGSGNITISVTGLNLGNATAGTLAVARGGTGANTAANARTSLGVPPTSHASTATTYGIGTASNYGHAMASSATPVVAGTASAGTDNGKYAREGHVHPAQTSVTGNAGTATKLATARTIAISGGATGTATSFDGSGNITIPVTGLNMGNATAGTLAVARGGTGATTAANARTSLGVPPTSHASNATTYGVATTANYGHVKVTTGNGLTLSSGTLSMNAASTSAAGTVQLNNTLTSTSTTQAATANMAKSLNDKITTINGNLETKANIISINQTGYKFNLAINEVACFFIANTVIKSYFKEYLGAAIKGTVGRSTNSYYDFLFMVGGGTDIYTARTDNTTNNIYNLRRIVPTSIV